jgi:hypothetical protein
MESILWSRFRLKGIIRNKNKIIVERKRNGIEKLDYHWKKVNWTRFQKIIISEK